jgi:lysophospholipase L1-like esterase
VKAGTIRRPLLVAAVAAVAAVSLYGLKERPQPAGRAILCLGDSLTESGWSGLLMWPERLGRSGAVDRVENAGRSGATTREVLRSWRGAGRRPYRWVAVLAGTNDIWLGKVPREESLRNLRAIWSEARAGGAAVVAMTTPPYKGDRYGLWSPARQADQDWLNESIRREARAQGYGLVDAWELLRSPSDPHALASDYDGGDHVHLNQAGQARLADAVARLLE